MPVRCAAPLPFMEDKVRSGQSFGGSNHSSANEFLKLYDIRSATSPWYVVGRKGTRQPQDPRTTSFTSGAAVRPINLINQIYWIEQAVEVLPRTGPRRPFFPPHFSTRISGATLTQTSGQVYGSNTIQFPSSFNTLCGRMDIGAIWTLVN